MQNPPMSRESGGADYPVRGDDRTFYSPSRISSSTRPYDARIQAGQNDRSNQHSKAESMLGTTATRSLSNDGGSSAHITPPMSFFQGNENNAGDIAPGDSSYGRQPFLESNDEASAGRSDQERNHRKKQRWWKIHFLRGIVKDIRRRTPYYKSDWTDAWNYRVIPATVYMFFAKYGFLLSLLSGG